MIATSLYNNSINDALLIPNCHSSNVIQLSIKYIFPEFKSVLAAITTVSFTYNPNKQWAAVNTCLSPNRVPVQYCRFSIFPGQRTILFIDTMLRNSLGCAIRTFSPFNADPYGKFSKISATFFNLYCLYTKKKWNTLIVDGLITYNMLSIGWRKIEIWMPSWAIRNWLRMYTEWWVN